MGISAYMRDDAIEIATLIRTEMLLRDFLHPFICGYEIGEITFGKVQNEYDSIKSGWEASLDVYKYGA